LEEDSPERLNRFIVQTHGPRRGFFLFRVAIYYLILTINKAFYILAKIPQLKWRFPVQPEAKNKTQHGGSATS
jgi:hypothetical protein